MKKTGTINRIDGRTIYLYCGTSSACKSCSAGSSCKPKERETAALNTRNLNLNAGDTIEIYFPPGKTILSGFTILIFPMLIFIGAFLLAGRLFPGSDEGSQALFGVLGLAVGFGISILFNRLTAHRNFPEVIKKMD
ncbi:MAG: SoxR reducing system RseC family protein [Spirochaetia bacterium]